MFVTQWPKAKPPRKTAKAGQQAVEEIERSDGRNADKEEQRPFDAQVREGLVQAFENPVSPHQQ